LRGDAGDVDATAVGFKDGADDGESHAGAFADLAALFSAIELVEDEGQIGGVDAGAIVLDAELEAAIAAPGAENDAAAGGRVAGGVFEEMAEDAAEEMGVEPDGGVGGLGADDDVMGREGGVGFFDGVVEQGAGELGRGVDLDDLGVDLGHFDGLADELVEAGAFFIDESGEVAAGWLVEIFIAAEHAGGGADGSKRGAQLVGERVDERGAEALAFA